MKLKEKIGKVSSCIEKTPGLKKINQLSPKKRRLVYLSVFLLIVIGATASVSGYFTGDAAALTYMEYEVSKGDITVAISGTSTVEPAAQYNVVSQVEGDVLKDTFKEGDTVTKGAILYKIDSSDMEKTLEKASISYEKSEMDYVDSVESYYGLTVSAPIDGRITEIFVDKGDSVSAGTKIATVEDDTYLTAKVSFGMNDIANLYVGEPVNVTLENTFEVLSGSISKIHSSKKVLDGYLEVTDVEVTVKNPGALSSGTYVTVNAGGIDCFEGAALEGNIEKIVTAKTSGLVSKVAAQKGEYLSRGDAIVTLISDSANDKLKDSELSLKNSALSYESTQDQLNKYNITAPISGTVIEKNVKKGDTLEKSDSSSTALCVIADMSVMTFTINVDELDVAKIKEDQEVNITADALKDRAFTGYVDNIGILGTSANGVTSYPVKIVIRDAKDLWPGMNVSAQIVVESAQNVLKIPVSAINRGRTVLVKGAQATERIDQTEAPAGSQYVRVELGLNDESYIEVVKGLSEGDIVMIPVRKSSDKVNSEPQMKPGFGIGGGLAGGGQRSGGSGMYGGGQRSGGGGQRPSGGGGTSRN